MLDGRDLRRLSDEKSTPSSAVVAANPNHTGWHLVIPCTNPANAKTFDHRQLEFTSLSPDAIRAALPPKARASSPKGLDGWVEPRRTGQTKRATRFVRAAAHLLTDGDWVVLSGAAYKEMHDSPAAFDLLSGLLWPLRDKVGAPSRNVAWLMLKLMAAVSGRARVPYADATFSPLRSLPKRQDDKRRKERSVTFLYPVSFPRAHRLEADLRSAIEKNMRQNRPHRIDWANLCHSLDQMIH